ncbi:hypothetical protein DPEC_G00023610 [Dallia pectoralis]|uniref:Uncharacterized protein n=1 Tax=Dallia pectoralis TaxID=75939 RepID=A0ACC2HHI0_DALPE|nr:hypothetical protein DPEC_G00023610 [Dallia pectoralis]
MSGAPTVCLHCHVNWFTISNRFSPVVSQTASHVLTRLPLSSANYYPMSNKLLVPPAGSANCGAVGHWEHSQPVKELFKNAQYSKDRTTATSADD